MAVGSPSLACVGGVADGAGYVDFGQEDWDDEAYSGDESNPAKRAKATGKTKGVFNNLAPKAKKKPTERVSNMFLGGGRGDVLGGQSKSKGGQDQGGDALLDTLLGDLQHDPMGVSSSLNRKRPLVGGNAARPAMPSYKPSLGGAAGSIAPVSINTDDYSRAPPRLSAIMMCEEPDDGAGFAAAGSEPRSRGASCDQRRTGAGAARQPSRA